MAAASYHPRILIPKYEQTDNVKPLTTNRGLQFAVGWPNLYLKVSNISFLVDYFKKLNTFLAHSLCFYKTVHNKWCLDRTFRQIENGFERGFVKHWLNYG